jgi:uncharacterized membrane protein
MLASRILFLGGVVAVLVIALGIAGFLWSHGMAAASARWAATANPHVIYTSVADVVRALSRWPVEPLAIVAAGVLLLLATPVVAVVAVFSVFTGTGDRRYAAICAVLIAALLVSLLVVSGR